MIFSQHYLACLSHASYLIGDETSGRAVVVDPRRDIGVYVEEAESAGLTIERVIETHLHADFLSGHLELAARTGAVISYGEGAHTEFPAEYLTDGQRLSLGEVTLEVLATPGHTPESICIAVYEHPHDTAPYAVLTGDTLFVGDVGRPDLLASAGTGLTADVLARRLYHSLHDRLLRLPETTRVYPAHGAGSSCGRQLSAETSSTLAEQRRTNYALQPMGEDAFVALVTEGQPPRPHYFEYDARRNRELHPLLDEATPPPVLDVDEVLARQREGALLLDAREPADFAAAHMARAVNVGLQGRFAEWSGDVLDPARDIVLVGDPETALEVKVRLGRVGFDRVVGQLDDLGAVLAERPELGEASSRLTIEQLAELRGLVPVQLVDVRSPAETASGTLPGARELPLAVVADSLQGMDRSAPTVVYCAGGYRSLIAASVLRRAGFEDVSDLLGGFGAWNNAGLPISLGDAPATRSGAPETGPTAAVDLAASGALVLDVREPDEWEAGHIPEATLLPMGQVQSRRDELPTDRRIIVVCRSGGRSRTVTEMLCSSGLDAVNLTGGMRAWEAAGLPVVDDLGKPGAVL